MRPCNKNISSANSQNESKRALQLQIFHTGMECFPELGALVLTGCVGNYTGSTLHRPQLPLELDWNYAHNDTLTKEYFVQMKVGVRHF